MFEEIFEKEYTDWDAKLKLDKFVTYLSKIPSSNKKFMKVLWFKGKDNAVAFNISTIQISQAIADGTAKDNGDVSIVRLVFSTSPSVKPCTCEKFKKLCAAISEALDGIPTNKVRITMGRDTKPNQNTNFRFYYDNETNYAILVHNTNDVGVREFLNAHAADIEDAMAAKEVSKPMTPKTAHRRSKNTNGNKPNKLATINKDAPLGTHYEWIHSNYGLDNSRDHWQLVWNDTGDNCSPISYEQEKSKHDLRSVEEFNREAAKLRKEKAKAEKAAATN